LTVLVVLGLGFFVLVKLGRGGREPWELEFTANPAGQVNITIKNDTLRISPVLIQTNVPSPLDFQHAKIRMKRRTELPVGKLVFCDVTRLPGRLTLEIGGHTLDVMERALIVNGEEISWQRAVQGGVDLNK
jgi:hypothetical protein